MIVPPVGSIPPAVDAAGACQLILTPHSAELVTWGAGGAGKSHPPDVPVRSSDQMAACSYGRPAMRLGMCRRRVAYSRARWLVNASNTMMLRPTVGRLVARVTASDPLALPMKAAIVVTTQDSISR